MRQQATTRVENKSDLRRRICVGFVYLWIVVLTAIVFGGSASGQDKDKDDIDPRLKPRPVSLKTKDGIKLRAFYFPSDKGKEAITVLIVHEWEGQASPYVKLVKALRTAGCAVLIPDYRGHGGSKKYTDARGKEREFNLSQMRTTDVRNIVSQDLESAKKFLKEENNDELLNLNALVVIGIREGCVLGMHWAMQDWSFATVGSRKRGQDVKGLVLISPKKTHKGLAIDQTLTNGAILSLPMMLLAGETSKEAAEATRIFKRVDVQKRKAKQMRKDEPLEELALNMGKNSLSGPQFLDRPGVIPTIVKFITTQVIIDEETNPWVERR